MLTVWVGAWGDKYGDEYLPRLIRAIERNLSMPYRIRVLAGIGQDLAGWWRKLALFAHDEPGINLWLDVDSVIMNSLDPMIHAYSGARIAMPKNWAQSGHDTCQSSVMIWTGGTCRDLYDDFNAEASGRLWGDQEWITERYGRPGEGIVVPIAHPLVVSYKYHCRAGPPDGAAIACFHGDPKPARVTDQWVVANWR